MLVAALTALRREVAVDLKGHCLAITAVTDADELGQVCFADQVATLLAWRETKIEVPADDVRQVAIYLSRPS